MKQAFSSQKRFVADASHELRSPLTALKGTLEVLLRRKRTVQEYEEGMVSCLEEINRLTRLVVNLLTLARTDTGKEKIAFKECRLDRLVEEVLSQMITLAEQKDIELRSEVKETINYYGDPDKLRQLVNNLLNNAVRYTPNGGCVKLSLHKEGEFVQISVADNGIGIPSKDIPHVFDRFYRVDQSRYRDVPGGSGLGLAICQVIVNAHRGKIEVKSEPGQGSIFTVSLPCKLTVLS